MNATRRRIWAGFAAVAIAMLIASLAGVAWWSSETSSANLRSLTMCLEPGECMSRALSTMGEGVKTWVLLSSLTWASCLSTILVLSISVLALVLKKTWGRVAISLVGPFSLLGLIFSSGVYVTHPLGDEFQIAWGWALFTAASLVALTFAVSMNHTIRRTNRLG